MITTNTVTPYEERENDTEPEHEGRCIPEDQISEIMGLHPPLVVQMYTQRPENTSLHGVQNVPGGFESEHNRAARQ